MFRLMEGIINYIQVLKKYGVISLIFLMVMKLREEGEIRN